MSSPPPPLLVAEAAGEPAECVRMRVCPAKPHPAINYTLLSWMAGDRSREGGGAKSQSVVVRPTTLVTLQFRNVGQSPRTCLKRGPAPTTSSLPANHLQSSVHDQK